MTDKLILTVGTVIDGEIIMNGRPVCSYVDRESGYMHQDDIFAENLTVIEHLTVMVNNFKPSILHRIYGIYELSKSLIIANFTRFFDHTTSSNTLSLNTFPDSPCPPLFIS